MHLATVVKNSILSFLGAGLFGQAIAPEHIQMVGLMAGGVAAVVGAVSWVDKRIEDKIAAHNMADMARHAVVLEKIKDLKDALGG